MRRVRGALWLLCLGIVGAVVLSGCASRPQSAKAIRIVLVGDSTVHDQGGWGAGFKKLIDERVTCENHARNGRSSKSFMDEGHWAKALVSGADYVLIQFGHNDMPGKGPARETDPSTTYRAFMGRYVDESRAAGAVPVLVTSMTRRNFRDGKVATLLGDYAEAVRSVAREKDVPLVDLHRASIELPNRLGPAGSETLGPVVDGRPDRTHLSAKGQAVMAAVVVDLLCEVVPELAPHLNADSLPRVPPDLTDCTRIEVTYFPSTLRAIGFVGPTRILNADEEQYLESLKTIVVDDPNRIKVLAEGLRRGRYIKYGPLMERWADLVCYRGDEHLLSFADYGLHMRTAYGHWFQYESDPIRIEDIAPEVYPFYLRRRCATLLYRMGVQLLDSSQKDYVWPAPEEWSDVLFKRRFTNPSLIVTDYSRLGSTIAKQFVCPSAGEGRCHYAMNPECGPESPADTVLLFETKAGWNQHGGPELFTFEHHEPRGGCVLLRDGKVRFIRTEEELRALRWR